MLTFREPFCFRLVLGQTRVIRLPISTKAARRFRANTAQPLEAEVSQLTNQQALLGELPVRLLLPFGFLCLAVVLWGITRILKVLYVDACSFSGAITDASVEVIIDVAAETAIDTATETAMEAVADPATDTFEKETDAVQDIEDEENTLEPLPPNGV